MTDFPEEWKPVFGYEGIYEISNYGRVKRACSGKGTYTGKIIKSYVIDPGYSRVGLTKNAKTKSKYVHQLVMLSFVGECPEGLEVNHRDGDRANPRLNNLEYISRSENLLHRYTLPWARNGEKHWKSKLTDLQAKEIRSLKGSDETQKSIAKRFGISDSVIRDIWKGKTWKYI